MALPLAKLQAVLLTSGIQQTQPALYQVINQLILFVQQNINTQTVNTTSSSGDVTALKNRTYWTELDETANLPSSRQVVAGTGITLDYSTPNEVEVSASGAALSDYVVASDGTTPTPSPIDDGFGNFIYVPYLP